MLNPHKIKHLNYVVQRNWQNLPHSYSVDGHNDLDLFVSEADRAELEGIVGLDDEVDIRSATDSYYPDEINEMLLENRRTHGGFFVPSKRSYFLSLYYHDIIHKQDNPYKAELKRAFLDLYPAVKCIDDGVGFYP